MPSNVQALARTMLHGLRIGGGYAMGWETGVDNSACGTVNIYGGTVTATGSYGAAGIGGGTGGSVGATIITGGSVHAADSSGNIDVQGSVKDASGHTERCVTVDASTVIGTSGSLTASVQSGPFSSMQTDESGKLYFWMDENATDPATVQYGLDFYKLSVNVGNSNTMADLGSAVKLGVLDLSQESISIGASSISAKDANDQDAAVNANGYVIIQSAGGSTTNTIFVTGGSQQIILQNVDIVNSTGSAFSIASGASVRISPERSRQR